MLGKAAAGFKNYFLVFKHNGMLVILVLFNY